MNLAPFNFQGLSLLAAVAIAFSGGVLSSATPCVLAALPAACALTSAVPARKRALTGLAFTLGTTVSLTLLGTISAYLGRSLSLGARNLSLAFGVLLIVAGLLMTGLIGPARWNVCSVAGRKTTGLPAFLFGLVFGTVMAPCATPMLVAIIGLIAAGADPVQAAVLMFAYSLGHCILVFAASLSWGFVQELMQRYSAGLEFVRRASGILMCLAGVLLVYSAM